MHTNLPYQYDVAIIGAGFAGVGLAIRLKMNGRHNFIIFERADTVGGTWRDNTYPGCGCDVPSLLYSYSFDLNPKWSRAFSKQPEILEYLTQCKDKHEVEQHIRYQTEIIETVFKEEQGFWTLKDRDGNVFTARTIVSAIGPLNVPNIPKIRGLDDFQGVQFHSSKWRHDLDLKGKHVGVIGTGASAVQFVPEVAKEAKSLAVFQRTAPWISPKHDWAVSKFAQTLFKYIPFYQLFWRTLLYWVIEFRGLAFFGNKILHSLIHSQATRHIKNSIANPELRKAVTPNYKIGCKRILLSDEYYPALTQDHVSLVTNPIETIQSNGVRTKDGKEHPIDVLIFGTGFLVADFIRALQVFGRNGRSLFGEWQKTYAKAYYGITASGFPNLLFLVGPHTGLGHSSIIHMIESQINYILDYLDLLDKEGKDVYLDVKAEVEQAFFEEHDKALQDTVWASGCQSWYQNKDGKNTTLWKGLTCSYRWETKRVNPLDYEVVKVGEPYKI